MRWLLDPYLLAAWGAFAFIIVYLWTSYTQTHEMIYLLGSRRVFDPEFLARDFTWGHLPPTTALYDHLVAPLWGYFSEFTIVNIGRFLTWGLFAWSLAELARAIRLPAWTVVAGVVIWISWGQTFTVCAAPLEGFQVKSFSYPLMFFALAFAIRGRVALAGAAAGLATSFHIIVGGWAFLALFLSLLVNRKRFTLRQVGIFLLSATPFITPMVLGVALFHTAHLTSAESHLMDKIYVMFAMPHCCDVGFFMLPRRWVRALVIFAMAPIVILAWPNGRAAKILGGYLGAMVLFFFIGVVAYQFKLYWFLKLYPCQLAASLPALFGFMFVLGWIGVGRPTRGFGTVLWAFALFAFTWTVWEREILNDLLETPEKFVYELRHEWGRPPKREPLYSWIRTHTPRNSLFITPFINEFWPYAERAQVASLRHAPLDRRIIEWKQRLEELHQFTVLVEPGVEIYSEAKLSIPDLIRLRDRYGASYYLAKGERNDLAGQLVHADTSYCVYDVTRLTSVAKK